MTATLADVLPSAAASLGVSGFTNRLGVPESDHAVVALIDGLGWHMLVNFVHDCPFLSQHIRTGVDGPVPIGAAFPSTTPVGLASLGTGLLAGGHGMVGASFLLPETGRVLAPLHWGGEPTPAAVQPEPTVFEMVARTGRSVATVAPSAYQHSGLTRAALRGSVYHSSEGIASRVEGVQAVVATAAQSLTYLYWADLDRAGHEFGIGSPQWRRALVAVDRLLERVHEVLPVGAVIIVTADHGMVNCPPDHRISIELTRDLAEDVRHVAGEPRLRHIYAREGAQEDLHARWQAILGSRFSILTREELIDSGMLGPVDPMIAERVGDVVAVAEQTWMLTSHMDARVSSLVGQHGSWSREEMDIPALILCAG